MSKKPCTYCNGEGSSIDPMDNSLIHCQECGGTGIAIDDGALDADRAPQPPTDVDDDAAREWLARWDAFAIAAVTGLAVLNLGTSDLAVRSAALADQMMQQQPGDTE